MKPLTPPGHRAKVRGNSFASVRQETRMAGKVPRFPAGRTNRYQAAAGGTRRSPHSPAIYHGRPRSQAWTTRACGRHHAKPVTARDEAALSGRTLGANPSVSHATKPAAPTKGVSRLRAGSRSGIPPYVLVHKTVIAQRAGAKGLPKKSREGRAGGCVLDLGPGRVSGLHISSGSKPFTFAPVAARIRTARGGTEKGMAVLRLGGRA